MVLHMNQSDACGTISLSKRPQREAEIAQMSELLNVLDFLRICQFFVLAHSTFCVLRFCILCSGTVSLPQARIFGRFAAKCLLHVK